jgi:hypothetical protein
MKSVGGQMQARISVADSGVGTELEVLFEPKDIFIVLERVIEVAHVKDRTYSLCFHGERMPECLKDLPKGFNAVEGFCPGGTE